MTLSLILAARIARSARRVLHDDGEAHASEHVHCLVTGQDAILRGAA